MRDKIWAVKNLRAGSENWETRNARNRCALHPSHSMGMQWLGEGSPPRYHSWRCVTARRSV
eukprot:scaffold25809_cov113-Isochrysis_galbana.AAC.1